MKALARHGPYELWLKFGRRAYCLIELTEGEDTESVAEKLRELADVVARLKA